MSQTTVDDERASALRRDLVDDLVRAGSVVSPKVELAFRAVPRHLFAPEVSLDAAYANDVVRTKADEHGVTISSVSAPWLQAVMLEQAQIAPGMRCLEIGSGGYNAALMAELAGPDGRVTTVDIDPDVTGRARGCLDAAGYEMVRVVLADAEDGVPDDAPYDRILVTVGVWDVPPAWAAQLSDTGRVVVPLRLRGLRRSVCLARDGAGLVSTGHLMAGFVDVQGAGARPERLVVLHGEDVALRLDDDRGVDADGLRQAVAGPRSPQWSGVRFAEMEPFDELFLWLATSLTEFGLLARTRTDAAKALVDPASAIGTPTLLGEQSLAYLTYREADPELATYEFGAYGHGPHGAALAEVMCEQVRVWDRDHRGGPAARITVLPAATPAGQLPPGRVVPKRHTMVVISWP